VKFIKVDKGKCHFQIAAKERVLLFRMLRLYPVIPAAHQRLSRLEDKPEDQELLDAALAEQRAQNKQQALAMMNAKSRFRKNQRGYRFTIPAAQMEWLLQVLNDVRVGSWLALGSPDGPEKALAALNGRTAPHFWAMEISGHFQAVLLEAVRGN
jgi:hypothetical protein